MKTFLKKTYGKESIQVQFCFFETDEGVIEYHLLFSVTNTQLEFSQQLTYLQQVYSSIIKQELKDSTAIFRRYFLSDAANQADLLLEQESINPYCALSVVQQAPLNGSKIALWAYHQSKMIPEVHQSGIFEVSHNGYRHLWTGGQYNKAANSEYQTRLLLNDYVMILAEQQCSLIKNCIRTWFFVQNIDTNYAGIVKARKEVFMTQNLTEKTHYIASTGIEGRHANPNVLVTMDTYAVDGLQPEQIQYLYAPSHLNPTYEYGVTFERGVAITYGDRKQIYISGTASINNQGEVVFEGNILKQAERMFENIHALLQEAGATLHDIVQAIIYLRDPADYTVIEKYINSQYPEMPHLIVWAPVCRPGWLIETECIAIKSDRTPQYTCL